MGIPKLYSKRLDAKYVSQRILTWIGIIPYTHTYDYITHENYYVSRFRNLSDQLVDHYKKNGLLIDDKIKIMVSDVSFSNPGMITPGYEYLISRSYIQSAINFINDLGIVSVETPVVYPGIQHAMNTVWNNTGIIDGIDLTKCKYIAWGIYEWDRKQNIRSSAFVMVQNIPFNKMCDPENGTQISQGSWGRVKSYIYDEKVGSWQLSENGCSIGYGGWAHSCVRNSPHLDISDVDFGLLPIDNSKPEDIMLPELWYLPPPVAINGEDYFRICLAKDENVPDKDEEYSTFNQKTMQASPMVRDNDNMSPDNPSPDIPVTVFDEFEDFTQYDLPFSKKPDPISLGITGAKVGQIVAVEDDGTFKAVDIPKGYYSPGVYGVKFDGPLNTGETVHRIDKAVGLVANVGTDTETARNDFDSIYPWSHMRRACGEILPGGEFKVNAYKGEPGYASNGSNGEVFVECPLFYYRHVYEGDSETFEISSDEKPGFLPAPTAIRQGKNGDPASKMYFSAYRMATINGKVTSRSGVVSDSLISLDESMKRCYATGPNLAVETWEDAFTLMLLMVVEFGTRDIQSVMAGYCNLKWYGVTIRKSEEQTNKVVIKESDSKGFEVGHTIRICNDWGKFTYSDERIITEIERYPGDYAIIHFDGKPLDVTAKTDVSKSDMICAMLNINGFCDNVLSSSGSPVSNVDGYHDCVYRGIESPYSGAYGWLSDILIGRERRKSPYIEYDYYPWYLRDLSKYSNGKLTDDYVKLNYTVPIYGCIKKFGLDPAIPHINMPVETVSEENVYFPDAAMGRPSDNDREKVWACQIGGWHGTISGPMNLIWDMHPYNAYGLWCRPRLSIFR